MNKFKKEKIKMSENKNNQNNQQVEELDMNHLMQIRREKLKE